MVISEGVMIFDAVFHKCGIEKYAITISTLPIEYMLDYIGVPNTPSFVPVNNKGFSVPMTYFERAQNLFELTLVKLLLHYSVIPEFEQLLTDKFGDSRTTQEWEKVFASARRGVILMSFGTMARSTEMGIQRREAFVKAFKVITIPLFADQLRNARMMEYRKMGIVIDKDDVTEERLITAIKEILEPRYKKAAKLLSEQLRNKPLSSEEVLVRYVDYAIRYNL
ncbi:hypothetical protein NECAME_09738 [Necator americanus]|uniref:glucuronosyltransferase n=1 Tax=Necator americanus TaxID=51031 RepID=W2TF02_NECAM|nr:hypothetical protein NECAME_09738 [Necator americanus]ETN79597.1 hypothetical protein NECAME_09738 [Necator americanus]